MTGGKSSSQVARCKACGEMFNLKSNIGVHEEVQRLSAYLYPTEACCPTADCGNNQFGVLSNPDRYQRFGRTTAGSARFRCKLCSRLFSVPASRTPKQKRPELNELIFKLLINKAPMRRICEIAGTTPETVYTKMRFIRERCDRVAREFEYRLLSGFELPMLSLSADRQDYLINWGTSEDRRNIRLHGVGSADNRSGYVFGMHLDYDNQLDPGSIEVDAIDIGDYEVGPAFRRYARLWLKQDWNNGDAEYRRRQKHAKRHGVSVQSISQEDLPSRWDGDTKLPGRGMKVRGEYTLLAHFQLLAQLTQGSPHVLIYMDQDAGMRSASHVAFRDRIQKETAETFFVRISKDLTIDEKSLVVAQAQSRLLRAKQEFPGLSDKELRVELMKGSLRRPRVPERWQDRWVAHPFPNKSEPEKMLCHLTDREALDPDQRARFHLFGSLHGIDRFFMIVRRRLSLLERPISTASNTGRVWHSGNPYRPLVVEHLLTIIRMAYNYHWAGKDKKTPAMRLGLTDRPWTLQEILDHV